MVGILPMCPSARLRCTRPAVPECCLPAAPSLLQRRGDFAVRHKLVDPQGLVDRRSLKGILEEHARTTAANAVSLLTYNHGIPRRVGTHLSNYVRGPG